LPPSTTLRALTVVGGVVRMRGDRFAVEAPSGTSVVLPASLGAVELAIDHAHAILSSAVA
jgi:hypothetical protein